MHSSTRHRRPVRVVAVIVAIASVTTIARADSALDRSFDRLEMAAMTRMNAAMAAAPMTGDADRDFVAMMIPHHRGAIEMAELELAHGHDPRLRRLAQEIVVTQDSEIQVMRAIARDLASDAQKVRS